jgi:glutamine cyclotransferase
MDPRKKRIAVAALVAATVLLVVAAISSSGGAEPRQARLQQQDGYELVATHPHDSEAFTQGLEFRGRRLFETTGLNGRSSLRRVELATGEVLRRKDLPERYFGEGMTIFDDRLYWLTWQSQVAFEFEPSTFKRVGRSVYGGEGWGLTHNGRRLIMSNGSNRLVFRHPRTFEVTRRVRVKNNGEPVDRLNELEWVSGEVLANVWQTARIARIDPSTGRVNGWINVQALWDREQTEGDPDVPNGIAYMKEADRLFVTGKFWRHVYEIELTE